MLEEEKVAFFLASRLITRGNKGTLALTIMIIAMVFVNLIFLPSIITGVVVLFNQQTIDYSYGNLVIEPRSNQIYIENVDRAPEEDHQDSRRGSEFPEIYCRCNHRS